MNAEPARPAAPARPASIAPLVWAGALVLAFGWLARLVMTGRTEAFDAWVAGLIRPAGSAAAIGPAWLHETARDVTALGSYALLALALVFAVGYLALTSRRATAVLLAASAIGAAILNTLLKGAFDRPRPDLPGAARVFTESFPSAHAMVSAATWLILAAVLAQAAADRRLKIYFLSIGVLLTLLIGVSRVYVGVHHATDVLAGWCAGVAWALSCWTLADRIGRARAARR